MTETPGRLLAKAQDTLTDLVVAVAELTASITVKDQYRKPKYEECERRLQNCVEEIAGLKKTLNAVETAVN